MNHIITYCVTLVVFKVSNTHNVHVSLHFIFIKHFRDLKFCLQKLKHRRTSLELNTNFLISNQGQKTTSLKHVQKDPLTSARIQCPNVCKCCRQNSISSTPKLFLFYTLHIFKNKRFKVNHEKKSTFNVD